MVTNWACVFLSLSAISVAHGAAVPCQHKDDIENAVHGVYLEPHQHVAKRVANQPMRFSVSYDSSVNLLSANVQSRIMTIMPQLTSFLSQTLQVKPVGVPILLDRQCSSSSFAIINGLRYCANTCLSTTTCGQATVPGSHLKACGQCNGNINTCTQTGTNGTGVANTDYIFYVSASNTSPCGTGSTGGPTSIAFATYCQTESSLDRPIAGNINFCTGAFSSFSSDDYILTVAKHEALHALGFSSGLFPFWRDQNGAPRTPRDPTTNLPPIVNGTYQYSSTTVMPLTYNNWAVGTGTISHPVNLLVTPAVVAAAKVYFNCPTLTGVELDNQGGTGTAISHWEKRLLGNELMTGILTFNPLFSNLTLAVLQDTGWYQVNYSMAQPLVWGKSAGCPFVSSSCLGYINSRQASSSCIDPFCTHYSSSIDQLGCTVDRSAVSACNLHTLTVTPAPDYQYFSGMGANVAGNIEIADFCPFQEIFTYSGSSSRGTACANTTNNPLGNSINYLGETYGPGSACMQQGSVGWSVTALSSGTVYKPGLSGAGCYQYSCTGNSVQISVFGTVYPCSYAGQQFNISVTASGYQYVGSLLCPSYNELCTHTQGICLVQETAIPTTNGGQVGAVMLTVIQLMVVILVGLTLT
eukprot:Em0015g1152a